MTTSEKCVVNNLRVYIPDNIIRYFIMIRTPDLSYQKIEIHTLSKEIKFGLFTTKITK